MEMVGHQHIRDEFTRPLSVQRLQLIEEGNAQTRLGEDLSPLKNVAGDKVQRARKIEIRPFPSHGKSGGKPSFLTLRSHRVE